MADEIQDSTEDSESMAYGNGVRDSGHDIRITRSHDYDMNSQLVREEIMALRIANSEAEQRLRHTEQTFQDNRAMQMQLMDAQRAREASQAQTNATNANSQALAQLAVNVKLSGGIYLP